jgi:hypothetical protein
MVSSGPSRRLLAIVGGALWMLVLSAPGVFAADGGECVVEVSPKAATAGSVFVFNGSGFKPISLLLQKNDDEPIAHGLSVGEDDPWEVTVRSRTGDEGKWLASFTDEGANCTATVEFNVTLASTDVVEDLSTAAAATRPAVIGFFAAVLLFGLTGGVLMGRQIQSRSRVRS